MTFVFLGRLLYGINGMYDYVFVCRGAPKNGVFLWVDCKNGVDPGCFPLLTICWKIAETTTCVVMFKDVPRLPGKSLRELWTANSSRTLCSSLRLKMKDLPSYNWFLVVFGGWLRMFQGGGVRIWYLRWFCCRSISHIRWILIISNHVGVSINGGTPIARWFIMEDPIPPFHETSRWHSVVVIWACCCHSLFAM